MSFPKWQSRHHVEGITKTINEALVDADISMEDIDAIAVTEGPGLIGALLIGVNAAKALAFCLDKAAYSCSSYCGTYIC